MVSLESQRSGVSVKKKSQSSRSWILLDSNGQHTILGSDKYAVINRVQIHARDLRILDPLLSYPSTILGRDNAIVLNLEHIKAIITSKEVLLRDPFDENIIPIVEELKRQLPRVNATRERQEDVNNSLCGQNDIKADEEEYDRPFEFRALEVALEAICSYFDAKATELEISAYPALDDLASKVSSRNLDKIRKLKSYMTKLTTSVQKVRSELEQLLDDDNDMADLYLSRKLDDASSPIISVPVGVSWCHSSRASKTIVHDEDNDVEQLEMILECYFSQIDNTFNRLITLRKYIDDTEDYVNIELDNHRNQLIQLELFISSMDISLSVYSAVGAIFGMNLPFTWSEPEYGYMFKWVTGISGLLCVVMFLAIITYARMKGLLIGN